MPTHGLPDGHQVPATILTYRPGTKKEQYTNAAASHGQWTLKTESGHVLRVSINQDVPTVATVDLWAAHGWAELVSYQIPQPVIPLMGDQQAEYALRRTIQHLTPLLKEI